MSGVFRFLGSVVCVYLASPYMLCEVLEWGKNELHGMIVPYSVYVWVCCHFHAMSEWI